MDLAGLVRRIKRKSAYGDLNVTNDQATQDVIDAIVDRMAEIWRWHEWDWSTNETSLVLTADVADYTLGSTDGDILLIDPGSGKQPLVRMTRREYRKWYATRDTDQDGGEVFGYITTGRDSNDKLKLKVVHTPTSNQTVTVITKKRLTEYTVADIATNTLIQYFPKEVQELIAEAALADIYEIQDKPELAAMKRQRVERDLNVLVAQEENQPDRRPRRKLPASWRIRNRLRRHGTGVY